MPISIHIPRPNLLSLEISGKNTHMLPMIKRIQPSSQTISANQRTPIKRLERFLLLCACGEHVVPRSSDDRHGRVGILREMENVAKGD